MSVEYFRLFALGAEEMQSSSKAKIVWVGLGVAAAAAVVGAVLYKVMQKKKPTPGPAPLKPIPTCEAAPQTQGTGADPGFGRVSDMATESNLAGELAGQPVNIGHLSTKWEANAGTLKLVVDAPYTQVATEGDGTLADADKITIPLNGWEDSAVAKLGVVTSNFRFNLNTVETCMVIAGDTSNGLPQLAIRRYDGLNIPKGTKLPAFEVPLVASQ